MFPFLSQIDPYPMRPLPYVLVWWSPLLLQGPLPYVPGVNRLWGKLAISRAGMTVYWEADGKAHLQRGDQNWNIDYSLR